MRTPARRTTQIAATLLVTLLVSPTRAMERGEELAAREEILHHLVDAGDQLLAHAAIHRRARRPDVAKETLAYVDEICMLIRLERITIDDAVAEDTERAKRLLDEGKVAEAGTVMEELAAVGELQKQIAADIKRLEAREGPEAPGEIGARRSRAWDSLAQACSAELALAHALKMAKRDEDGDLAVSRSERLRRVMERCARSTEAEVERLSNLARKHVEGGRVVEAREAMESRDALAALVTRTKKDLERLSSERADVGKSKPKAPPSPAVLPKRTAQWLTAFGTRMDRRHLRPNGGSSATETAVSLGLSWLARHQSPEGFWDSDGFMRQGGGAVCDGAGYELYDVGVTGLALLAFLGAGQTHERGRHREVVRRGLLHLRSIQDPEGCIGPRVLNKFTYFHPIAALAVVEAYSLSGSPELKRSAQGAIDFIHKCRNPDLVWRYGVRPKQNDTSVSGWMTMALHAGRVSGLKVDPAAFEGMTAWLDKVTLPATGRAGYTAPGNGPARPQELLTRFPAEKSESMTAVGILARIFMGEGPHGNELIRKGTELCMKALPTWDEDAGTIDMYYWFYGTMAMFQLGGEPWSRWNTALKKAVLPNQRKRPSGFRGSWDPAGPWGPDGGRIYSTAMCVLMLEAYYRHGRIFERAK